MTDDSPTARITPLDVALANFQAAGDKLAKELQRAYPKHTPIRFTRRANQHTPSQGSVVGCWVYSSASLKVRSESTGKIASVDVRSVLR